MSVNVDEQILTAVRSIASATRALVRAASDVEGDLVARGKVCSLSTIVGYAKIDFIFFRKACYLIFALC